MASALLEALYRPKAAANSAFTALAQPPQCGQQPITILGVVIDIKDNLIDRLELRLNVSEGQCLVEPPNCGCGRWRREAPPSRYKQLYDQGLTRLRDHLSTYTRSDVPVRGVNRADAS